MEKQNLRSILAQYNSLCKEMDKVYHSLARHYGMSDSALWIFYVIRESKDILTQSKICEQLALSKQTVNSALKNLEKTGYIQQEPVLENQRNKQILLTDAGLRFAEQTVDNIFQMEQNTFEYFSPEERTVFIQLVAKYTLQLQKEAGKILTAKES